MDGVIGGREIIILSEETSRGMGWRWLETEQQRHRDPERHRDTAAPIHRDPEAHHRQTPQRHAYIETQRERATEP